MVRSNGNPAIFFVQKCHLDLKWITMLSVGAFLRGPTSAPRK